MNFSSVTLENQMQYQIEHNCLAEVCQISDSDPASVICAAVWNSLPLLGEYIPTRWIREKIIASAKVVFQQLLRTSATAQSLLNERILALALIYLTQAQDADNENKLWDFLFAQLGYHEAAAKRCSPQLLRKKITECLDHVFRMEQRFFSTDGHRYFNTLRLHALAPAQTVEHLLNLLYHFYKENLEYQYIKGDNSYRIFVRQICRRWENTLNAEASQSDMKTRSDYLAASFREMFIYRPEFTAALCDALVCRMDALLRGNQTLLSEDNRWDAQMLLWYQKKSTVERRTMENDSRVARRERVVTESTKICPAYGFRDGVLSVSLPRIRLPEITERPTLIVLQEDRVVYSAQMSVFGNDLCLTTREVQINLSDCPQIDWAAPMHFRILLQCGSTLIFDSGQQLCRSYLLFHENGEETKKIRSSTETMYLVVGKNTDIFVEDTEDSVYCSGRDYRIYEIRPATIRILAVDGVALLPNGVQELLCGMEGTKVTGAYVTEGTQKAALYCSPPTLHIALASSDLLKQYVLEIDGNPMPLYQAADGHPLAKIPLPAQSGRIHRLCVRSFSEGKTVYSQCYYYIPDFSYRFQPAFFYSRQLEGSVQFSAAAMQNAVDFVLNCTDQTVSIPLTFTLSLELAVPWLRGDFDGDDAFSLPENLWKDYFQTHPFLRITVPKDLRLNLMLGGTEISEQRQGYDVLSAVRTFPQQIDHCMLGLLLRADGAVKPIQIPLADVTLKPRFTESPVICRNRTVIWHPIGTYIGPEEMLAYVYLENDESEEPWSYYCELDKQNVLEQDFPCPEGDYAYEVRIEPKRKSAFQKNVEMTVWKGTLKIRDLDEVRFEGTTLYLTGARFHLNDWWSKEASELTIPRFRIRLTDIRYQTVSVPRDGKLKAYQEQAPCFRATLQFYVKRHDCWMSFNNDPYKVDYRLINPVVFWKVTDSSDRECLILLGSDGKRIRMRKLEEGRVYVENRCTSEKPMRADLFLFEFE